MHYIQGYCTSIPVAHQTCEIAYRVFLFLSRKLKIVWIHINLTIKIEFTICFGCYLRIIHWIAFTFSVLMTSSLSGVHSSTTHALLCLALLRIIFTFLYFYNIFLFMNKCTINKNLCNTQKAFFLKKTNLKRKTNN